MAFQRFLRLAVTVLLFYSPRASHQTTCYLERECAEEFEECFQSLRTIDIVHYLIPTAAWDVELMCRDHEVEVKCPTLWSSACASSAQVDLTGKKVSSNWTVGAFQRGFCNGGSKHEYAADVLCYTTTRRRSKTLNCRTKLRGDEAEEKHAYTFQLEYCKRNNVGYRHCLLKAARRTCPGKPRRFIINILPVVFDLQCPLCTRKAMTNGATAAHHRLGPLALLVFILLLVA